MSRHRRHRKTPTPLTVKQRQQKIAFCIVAGAGLVLHIMQISEHSILPLNMADLEITAAAPCRTVCDASERPSSRLLSPTFC